MTVSKVERIKTCVIPTEASTTILVPVGGQSSLREDVGKKREHREKEVDDEQTSRLYRMERTRGKTKGKGETHLSSQRKSVTCKAGRCTKMK